MTQTCPTLDPCAPNAAQETHPIIFFDGLCGLCDRSMQWVLWLDRQRVLRFAPLQGETAAHLLGITPGQEFNTVVVRTAAGNFEKSSAVVRILWLLGGLCSLLGTLLWLVPRPLRDLGYRWVASSRYHWFGKKSACRIPTPEERALFLP